MRDNTSRLILASLLREPEKTAIGDDQQSLSRANLLENVRLQAEQMVVRGVKANEFVLVPCDRGLSFWTELLACWVIGAKPICIESSMSDEHASSIIAMTKPAWIIGAGQKTSDCFSHLKAIDTSFDASVEPGNIYLCFESLPFASDEVLPDLAGLIFTSGTSGLPKGVPLTHRALISNALATAQRLRLKAHDRLMIATPFRFISSISHFIVTLLSGASFFGLERPMMIKDLLSALNELKITAFGGSPFHMQYIAMAGSTRLPHLRWGMSSGDHLRVAVIEQLNESFDNLELHVVYGMAELGGRFCELPPEAQSTKAGSVGFPINGFEVAVRREDGSRCDVNEIGNIYVSGQLEFNGYYENPKANSKVLSKLGFENGDKGYLDADGYLYLSGRSDSVFKRSGLKVSAQVVSDALMSLDSVDDVFVGSEQSAMEGHVPVAYICSKNAAALNEADLTRTLRSLVPVNHIPARYVAVPAIPRTGSGKVDRRKLNAMIDELEPSSKSSLSGAPN